MATNAHKKPSKELRPHAVALQKASVNRAIQVIAQSAKGSVTPVVLGHSQRVKLR
jgi:hypothetical protein